MREVLGMLEECARSSVVAGKGSDELRRLGEFSAKDDEFSKYQSSCGGRDSDMTYFD